VNDKIISTKQVTSMIQITITATGIARDHLMYENAFRITITTMAVLDTQVQRLQVTTDSIFTYFKNFKWEHKGDILSHSLPSNVSECLLHSA